MPIADSKPLEIKNRLKSRKWGGHEIESMPTLTNNNTLIVFANSTLSIRLSSLSLNVLILRLFANISARYLIDKEILQGMQYSYEMLSNHSLISVQTRYNVPYIHFYKGGFQ